LHTRGFAIGQPQQVQGHEGKTTAGVLSITGAHGPIQGGRVAVRPRPWDDWAPGLTADSPSAARLTIARQRAREMVTILNPSRTASYKNGIPYSIDLHQLAALPMREESAKA
jgi:hypothetical protein